MTVKFQDLTSNEIHTFEEGMQYRNVGDEGGECTYDGINDDGFRLGEIVEVLDDTDAAEPGTWYASKIVEVI